MLTKVLAVALAFVAGTVTAQVPSRAPFFGQFLATGGGGTPNYDELITNITGYAVYSWYPVHGHYDATGILTNSAGNADLNLTNTATPPTLISGGLNGKDYLAFDGSNDYLRADPTAVTSTYYDLFIVMAYTNTTTSARYYFTLVTGGITSSLNTIDNQLRWSGATGYVTNTGDLSASWNVIEIVNDNDKTAIYTNGVCAATNVTTMASLNTLTVGARENLASFVQLGLSELLLYATNFGGFDAPGVAASGNRSNVTWALKQKHGLP